VSELYLAEGKKRQRIWKSAAAALAKLGVPKSRIDHLVAKDNPALLADIVKELA
jgi:ATP/maltotriose-dependent transcriptional regulator MalT